MGGLTDAAEALRSVVHSLLRVGVHGTEALGGGGDAREILCGSRAGRSRGDRRLKNRQRRPHIPHRNIVQTSAWLTPRRSLVLGAAD